MLCIEWLTSSAAGDKAEVVEARHLVVHDRRRVDELAGDVVVVAGGQRHRRAVLDGAERHDAERHRQRLVDAPVLRQDGADHVRTPGPDELLRQVAHGRPQRSLADQNVHLLDRALRRRTHHRRWTDVRRIAEHVFRRNILLIFIIY